MVEALKVEGMTRQLVRHCELKSDDGGRVHLLLAARSRHLYSETRRAEIEQALSTLHAQPKALQIEVVEDEVDSPTQQEKQRVIQRQQEAEAAIEADPTVRALRESLGASVRPGSVQPLD